MTESAFSRPLPTHIYVGHPREILCEGIEEEEIRQKTKTGEL